MGVSTNAYLSYGLNIGEGYDLDLPWLAKDEEDSRFLYEEDPFNWWYEAVHPMPDGLTGKDRELFYDTHPKLPFDLVSTCSASCPMHILAVRGTEVCAWRGEPKAFDLKDLVIDYDALIEFTAFIKEYVPQLTNEPLRWWLSSYYG